MKKTKKTLALLAAASLILGGLFLSCSNSSSDDDEPTDTTQNAGGSSGSATDGTIDGTSDNGGSENQTVSVNAAWDFTGNARDGEAVDGVSATKGGAQPTEVIELTTNKTGSGATMTVLTNTKCEWNGKLQFSTGSSDKDLFTITTDAACTAVIKVGSASSSKASGKVNALKLGETTIFDFDTVDTAATAVEKTVFLTKGTNTFSGSGITIATITLSN